jgi:hypothetical protein
MNGRRASEIDGLESGEGMREEAGKRGGEK